MGQRKKKHARCKRCGLHVEDCLCADLSPIWTETRLVLVLHRREAGKPTNTGQLAMECLANSERHIRGLHAGPADLSGVEDPERRMLILFPRDGAVELTPAFVAADPRPVTLLVPDGTWSQARRAAQREGVLRRAQAVLPPPGPPSRYGLRLEHDPAGMATAEAIARAFGVLEGPAVQAHIEAIFHRKIARAMATRPLRPGEVRTDFLEGGTGDATVGEDDGHTP